MSIDPFKPYTFLFVVSQIAWNAQMFHMKSMFFYSRDFLEKYYIGLKKDNPKLPILVRECSGIQPKIYARFGKNK